MKLLAFDLHKEVFGAISIPMSANSQQQTRMSHVLNFIYGDALWIPDSVQHTRMSQVLDYEGSAAMIFKEYDDHGSVLNLWTLDKSWTRRFNLEADLKVLWVFLYLGVGQFVVGDNNGEILLI